MHGLRAGKRYGRGDLAQRWLDPQAMCYICVKSAAHFRAAFEPWAGVIHVIPEPRVHSADIGHIKFYKLGRKLYSFDPM